MNAMPDIYPSRRGSEEALLERKDPVVYADGGYGETPPLEQEQLRAFERRPEDLANRIFLPLEPLPKKKGAA